MEIHWVGLGELSEAEREDVAARLEALAAGHNDLIDVRVTGRESGHHQHGDAEVRITCLARGREIVAARSRAELGLALNEALDTFEREVHRMRDKRRDAAREQPPEPPLEGVVDRIFREDGYGFILTDAGDQVYFHRNAVKEGLEFERLQEADRVGLDIEAGRKGLQATTVFAPPPR